MLRIPTGRRQTSWLFYKRGRGVELWSTVKQLQLVVRAGLEPGTSDFQVQRPNHSTTLLPLIDRPGSLGLFKMAAPRSNGMFVMFQRKKKKRSVDIDCSQSMHMERKLQGNELRKAITRQGWVNDENMSPIARNDNVALSLQFIPNFGLSLHFIPSLQSAVCILYLVCILYPVCSLQSAVCSLHFVLTDFAPCLV